MASELEDEPTCAGCGLPTAPLVRLGEDLFVHDACAERALSDIAQSRVECVVDSYSEILE